MNPLLNDNETLLAKETELKWNIENMKRMLTEIEDGETVPDSSITYLHQKVDYIKSTCITINKLKGN